MNNLAFNLKKLFKDVEETCKKVSRNLQEIRIIAATKYADIQQVQLLYDLGIRDFGENKADDLVCKSKCVKVDSIWHFIGHLQSNKIKKVVPIAEYIHSIDSISTLSKINDFAKHISKIQNVLIEVNVSEEKTKYGLKIKEVNNFIHDSLKYDNIKICGLMTIAPLTNDFIYIRKLFISLKIALDDLNKSFKNLNMSELSMGMSNDFKIAIQEGATMIRIGSAIFK